MKLSKVTYCATATFVALALLADCSSGTSSITPLGSSVARSSRAGSWMSRDAQSQNLLYVSIQGFNDVYVYSYLPSALDLVGKLTGFSDPNGLCVDKAGNVYVANAGAKNILEYAHGGTKPIATLSDENNLPFSCSIDPSTGDLAVSGSYSSFGKGDIAIYKGARGTPEYRADGHLQYPDFAGYDDSGNLFIDGIYYYYKNSSCCFVEAYAELPKGAKAFKRIDLNYDAGVGGVQWDGKYLAIGSGNSISEYQITGSKGSRVHYTKLGTAHAVAQFWIRGSAVVGADNGYADVNVWRYPHGGPPTKRIEGLYGPFGVTVSLHK